MCYTGPNVILKKVNYKLLITEEDLGKVFFFHSITVYMVWSKHTQTQETR